MTEEAATESRAVLVVGATSAIGTALCRQLASDGYEMILAGRDVDELARLGADLTVRGSVKVRWEPFEALDFAGHPRFWERCLDRANAPIEGVVICHGYLPDSAESRRSFAEAKHTIDVNFTSVVSLLTPIATWMEDRHWGWIAVISSVAGDRGRQSNYVYGSAKGALSLFLQGLRNRLFHSGVNVLTIKPGFVDTPMLREQTDPPVRLVASPESVAKDIARAITARKMVVYVPRFWQFVMLLIRMIPERIFRRLNL